MQLIDISPPVRAGIAVWPGDTQFRLEPKWSIAAGDSVNVSTVTSTTHVGAHIDGASHIIAGAPSVYETPLESCIGACVIVEVSDLVGRGTDPHTQPDVEEVRRRVLRHTSDPVERLLLRFQSEAQSTWYAELPGVPVALMKWFGQQGGRLMGIDIASFDPADSKTLECHKEAISQGVVMLEGLDLSQAFEGHSELIALPMPWTEADASPVRAVLRYV